MSDVGTMQKQTHGLVVWKGKTQMFEVCKVGGWGQLTGATSITLK